jgi:DNA-binding FadR family transcriptional regulator
LQIADGMDRTQIHRVSVADHVAAVLRQQILAGELRPGALLEVPPADSLDVSRNANSRGPRIVALEELLGRRIHQGVAVAMVIFLLGSMELAANA